VKSLASIALAFAASGALAQPQLEYRCDSPESKQFDFWLGEWDLAYVESGKAGRSRNHVTKTLDGCAILEEFSGAPGTRLNGRSFSVFDRATRHWKQTWVDNTASYLDFTGGFVDGSMVLSREAPGDSRKFHQRMVWEEIKGDSLKWLWQRSDDGGKTWSTQWEIDYKRAR
jgi:hypothetical protein